MKRPRYYWIITKDHHPDLEAKEGTNANAKGVEGPRGCVDVVPDGWKKEEFRMYDDDDTLYYEGDLYFDPAIEDFNPEFWFFPLEDFGEPNAGCTGIKYKHIDGSWNYI